MSGARRERTRAQTRATGFGTVFSTSSGSPSMEHQAGRNQASAPATRAGTSANMNDSAARQKAPACRARSVAGATASIGSNVYQGSSAAITAVTPTRAATVAAGRAGLLPTRAEPLSAWTSSVAAAADPAAHATTPSTAEAPRIARMPVPKPRAAAAAAPRTGSAETFRDAAACHATYAAASAPATIAAPASFCASSLHNTHVLDAAMSSTHAASATSERDFSTSRQPTSDAMPTSASLRVEESDSNDQPTASVTLAAMPAA